MLISGFQSLNLLILNCLNKRRCDMVKRLALLVLSIIAVCGIYPKDEYPVWSPNGEKIAFESDLYHLGTDNLGQEMINIKSTL